MERKNLEKYLVSDEDHKKQIREADEALPQDVRDQYPAVSLKEMKEKYKNKWVAFLVTDITKGFPIAGRVVATAENRPELEDVRDLFWARLQRCPSIINTEWLDSHPLAR